MSQLKDPSTLNLRKINFEELKQDLLAGQIQTLSVNFYKELLKAIEKAIVEAEYLPARNSLCLAIFFKRDLTFGWLRKKGLFRYSKYVHNTSIVKNLSVELKQILQVFSLSTPPIENYLDSVINYSVIFEQYKKIDNYLITQIKAFGRKYPGKSFLKTILAYADMLFLSGYFPERNENLSMLESRNKEDITAAISFLVHLYTDRVKSTEIEINRISEAYLKSEDFKELLLHALYYSDLKEFEIQIDHFSYTCTATKGEIHIRAPYQKFEKAIRLGYIRTVLQQINHQTGHSEASSIEDLVDKLYSVEKFKIFEKVSTHDYPRYTLNMPEPIFDYLVEHFLKVDSLFKDEVQYLYTVFKEQLLKPDDFANIFVKEDLSLSEFMKIRRIFLLFYLLFAKKVYEEQNFAGTDVLFRSLVPIFPEERFYALLTRLFPRKKIDAFLDIVCWEPGAAGVFDLQYHPILYIDEQFIFPLSVFANSNSIRNLYASEYKKNNTALQSDGSVDPLVENLIESLSQASIPCFKELSVQGTDIDVLAVYEDVLFVFECKHNLHPVSPFDLRTTHDYIQKAISQLDKISDQFTSGKLIPLLKKKLNIDLKHIQRIQCSIVLSNRIFNGNIFKYPVRNIGELDNMLTLGILRTKDGAFSLWKNKVLSVDFLLGYLSLTNNLIETMFDSMTPMTTFIQLNNLKVKYDTFYVEVYEADAKLKEITEQLEPYEFTKKE